MSDYETPGIENVARGVCISRGRVLLCRPRDGGYSYLPGGHIEFGEKGAEALRREIQEELGVESTVGEMIGVVESAFIQKGKPHAEINLVYKVDIHFPDGAETAKSQEDWIEFVWWPVDKIRDANLLPPEMTRYVGM